MGLIVYGHVAHASTVWLTPPIYLKQLGVAFFLFATGFTLARERRDAVEVLFNRLFPVYFFGLSLAALIAALGLATGSGLALSNVWPFLAGANVLFDNFPANPTTWYLGTYVHVLVLWALLLRRVRVRLWMVAMAVVIEIPVRALLIATAGRFVAYMLLTNWLAVFLLGMARGGADDREAAGGPLPYAGALLAGGVAWGAMTRPFGFDPTFPFMSLDGWPSASGLMVVSATASLLYVSATWLVYEATRRAAAPATVRFVARNSLIIFLAHMPVFLALHPVLVKLGLTYWARVGVQCVVCLGVLAALSEAVHLAIDLGRLRTAAYLVFTSGLGRRRPRELPLPS